MEPVGLDRPTNPFSRSNEPERSPLIFGYPKFQPNWSRPANSPIFKVKRAPEQVNFPILLIFVCYSPWTFGDLEFRCDFCQIFLWTFVKTLAMEPLWSQLVPTGEPDHFQGQTSPKAGKPLFLPIFRVLVHKFLVILKSNVLNQLVSTGKSAHLKGQISPEQIWIQLVPMGKPTHFLGQTSPRVGKPPILPIFHLLSQFVPTSKPSYFQGQMSPRAGQLPILPIFVCYSLWIFGDPEFRCDFYQNFSCTSVKTLTMEPVGPDGQNRIIFKLVPIGKSAHFEGQMIPRAGKPTILLIFVSIVHGFLVIQNFDTGKPTHFQGETSLRAELSSETSWSRRVNRPIFKVKRSPEQLLSQSIPTGKSAHFQGETSPIAGKPPVLPIFGVL
ncbi:hypothetical protein H5410_042218 [Solanum commersonii]|uniref:Uncharacterized protein n=1 Tax=Solanum commersonii TaxID=4109 RepID=A0A9J5XWV9_SOLCO|nr:hypothetical protein H5410_042218 [Solanum commersonii]